MKVKYNGMDYPVLTPDEVILHRESLDTDQGFNDMQDLNPSIAARLAQIKTVYGIADFEWAINLIYADTRWLKSHYSFKYGYESRFGMGRLPSRAVGDKLATSRYFEYVIRIYEAFGWSVSWSETAEYYCLSFAPLLTLTPAEVNEEIRLRVDALAKHAQQVIYAGLLKRKNIFTPSDLNLDYKDADFPFAYERLTEILSPDWNVHILSSNDIRITPRL